MKEPGCEQFEVFQSVVNPDKLAILERWTDQEASDRMRGLTARFRRSSPSCAPATPNAKTTYITGRADPDLDR
jgi:quinol monooxygenase YgiN